MKTEKFSAENKWRQTQLNENNGEIWKMQIKKIFKNWMHSFEVSLGYAQVTLPKIGQP
jgi:hypothetical protein